jgi:hypothetical protein
MDQFLAHQLVQKVTGIPQRHQEIPRDSGEGKNATNTVRASLYDRISTHDQQTLPMQIRGPGDKSLSLARENLAMRKYGAQAWLDHSPTGDRSRLWSFPAATAKKVV